MCASPHRSCVFRSNASRRSSTSATACTTPTTCPGSGASAGEDSLTHSLTQTHASNSHAHPTNSLTHSLTHGHASKALTHTHQAHTHTHPTQHSQPIPAELPISDWLSELCSLLSSRMYFFSRKQTYAHTTAEIK